METGTRICQNCKKQFVIEPEDFDFYEKIKVPPPSWCPECRMVRRLSSANGWFLFYRDCDKCGKRTLSMYPPEQKIMVYCQPCWWGDGWDGSEYARDYDPQKHFFEQLGELVRATPHPALETEYLTLKNCDYSNAMGNCKNCTLTIWADYCESVYYSSILNGLKWSSDCLRGFDSELCYESIGFSKNYRTFFSDECDSCVDVWFSRDCYGCTNCIGCVNLRGATNCIFNIKYSREEYAQKVQELGFDSWKNLHAFKKRARDFWLTKPYREHHGNSFNLNVTGEHIYNSRNSKDCYITNGADHCKFCQFITVKPAKDCMDYSGWGNGAELVYDSASVGANASNVRFSAYCFPDVLNLEYCLWCIAGKNNFGCANLKRKSYSILNKQYSKEEYGKLREEVISNMKRNPFKDALGRIWSYGEFFAPVFNRFAYNNSNAMKFFPKTKEEALREGYFWNNAEIPSYNISIKSSDLPDSITEAADSILEQVIECSACSRGYRILQGEFDLLQKMSLPIPRECPKCRESKRFARMTKPKLYHKICVKCREAIYTPYAPDRPVIVYCVKCYQSEFA